MKAAATVQNAPRGYRKTGLFTLRRHLIDLGSRAIDGRSSVGVALRKWKADLIRDLGGEDLISTQEETLVELAARSKIMLDSIDNWILGQPTLINSRKKTMLAVVQQRQTIADGLTRVLKELGLKRVAKDANNLEAYVREKYGSRNGEIEQETMQSGRDEQDAQPEANHVAEGNDPSQAGKIDGESGA
jgi:hypothetical protein